MFTQVIFYEDIDTAVLALITAVADPHVRVVGDDIVVPDLDRLMGVYPLGANMVQCQIHSPGLASIIDQDIYPLSVGAEPLTPVVPHQLHDYFDRPIQLVRTEALNALVSTDAGAAIEQVVVCWLGDGLTPVPSGDMRTLRCTNADTLDAYEWTNGALVLTQGLPAGRYAVVGMTACSAGMIAARLVFPGDWARPGCIGQDSVADVSASRFRYGAAGSWGEFEHSLPPTVDFFSVSADTAQVVHLDLVQVRSGPV